MKDSFYDFLFFDEEGTDDFLLDTGRTRSTSVGTVDRLLRFSCGGVLTRTKSGETRKGDPTVAALWSSSSLFEVEVSKFSAGGLDDFDLVGSGVVWEGLV